MTNIQEIKTLKTLAKRYARATRKDLHEALDLVAKEMNHPHWNALMAATKKGWKPSADDVATVQERLGAEIPYTNAATTHSRKETSQYGPFQESSEVGEVQGHKYELRVSLDDVHMFGEDWHICVPEAPNAAPVVTIEERSANNSPMNDPRIVEAAVQVAIERSDSVRMRISTDWSRRSTKPDADGRVRHPLFLDPDGKAVESDKWYCLHCDGQITGAQVAEYLWHCPACGANPTDLFAIPFWHCGENEPPQPVDVPAKCRRPKPIIQVTDSTPRLNLDTEKIALLIRSALLDDASNAGEKLGALLAEVSVDDELDIWISFETEYWPQDKEPVQALAVAELLGCEVFLEVKLVSPPFAWPGIGEHAASTLQYVQMLLDAYEQQSRKSESKEP